MLSMRWTTLHKGELKTIHLKKNPLRHGLGVYEDTGGERWDVRMVIGGQQPYVAARRVAAHSTFYATSDVGSGQGTVHRWLPYLFTFPAPSTQPEKGGAS